MNLLVSLVILGKPDIALGELEDLQRLQPRWQPTVMADNCLKLTISSHRSKVEDLFLSFIGIGKGRMRSAPA